jgi:hypothetical protein
MSSIGTDLEGYEKKNDVVQKLDNAAKKCKKRLDDEKTEKEAAAAKVKVEKEAKDKAEKEAATAKLAEDEAAK